jgi:hypothetical protein
VFAQSHVAWLRGVGPVGPNQFQKIEIWAAPFSETPGGLSPYQVGDYVPTKMPATFGGFGRMAMVSGEDAPVYAQIAVWNLTTKQRQNILLPGGRRLSRLLGLTSNHLWAAAAPQLEETDRLLRYDLVP